MPEDMWICFIQIFMRRIEIVCALLTVLGLPLSAQEGIHISTTTSYDYARHVGVVSVESFVEGEVQVIKEATALDIVLVLDLSGSMDSAMKGEKFVPYDSFDRTKPVGVYYDTGDSWLGVVVGGRVTKLGRMMDAAYSFAQSIEANARATGLDHRVGIVTFSSAEKTKTEMQLTGIQGHLEEFREVIYGFRASGATESDTGLRLARELFDSAPLTQEQRTRTVLMFTDGEPTDGLIFSTSVANRAIQAALGLKQDLQCNVFAVGMFADDVYQWIGDYMNALSSNYPLAQSMSSLGSGEDKGYYVRVTDAGTLSGVFDGISEEIIVGGAKVELSETAQIRDYMPPYMQLPQGTGIQDIHIYTCRCVAYDASSGEFIFSSVREPLDPGPQGITISVDEDGCTMVSVTGFNYKEHWCGPGMTSGRKLIVNIPFELSAVNNGEFNPNQHESGLYGPDGSPAGSFEVEPLRFFDLVVQCSGLCAGESAVYRLMDGSGTKILCRFGISADGIGIAHDSSGACVSRTLRNVPQGEYILVEEGWNWAYTTAGSKSVRFTLDGPKTIRYECTHKTGDQSPLHTEVHRAG